jgi:hypothetical protein
VDRGRARFPLVWKLRSGIQQAYGIWLFPLLIFVTANDAAAEFRPAEASANQSVDIVIAGAGTGGISAAIQAARLGARVALLEETDWIGGQMTTSGDATMDEGSTGITLNSGIYAEFVERMHAYYLARGKSVGTCYGSDQHHCYEPSAIQKILYEMLNDAKNAGPGNIDLYLREKVTKVLEKDQTVLGVVTARGHAFQSRIVIDATELGDVLPLTRADYRIGRFTNLSPGHSCIQDITYMAILKKYSERVPSELVMQHAPPGYDAAFIAGMRRFLRADGNPDNGTIPVNFDTHNRLRALPDSSSPYNYTVSAPEHLSRTAVNWFNDYQTSTDIFDLTQRQKIFCAAKLRTLDLIYYIQNELKESQWSVANDEGYNTAYNREENSCPNIPQEYKAIEANFPLLPYIRESRRLMGQYTLTGGDVRREAPWPDPAYFPGAENANAFSDSIAVGDYTIYLHDCNSQGDLESELDRSSDIPKEFRNGSFQAPIEALIPAKEDGLLAAEKNISESRIGNSVTRMQPISMLIGQAAGALAAIAAKQGIQPRLVNPEVVQRTLLDFNVTLAKEELADIPRNVDEWRAAEFALVHKWLPEIAGGFIPNKTMSRAEGAEALAAAFHLLSVKSDLDRRWGYEVSSEATFKDVPLYSKYSAAVEALVAVKALPACNAAGDMFCPEEPETIREFIASVRALKSLAESYELQASSLERVEAAGPAGAVEHNWTQKDGSLKRIKAAEVLYEALEPSPRIGGTADGRGQK